MSLFAKIRWALACGLVCGVVLFQSGDVLTYWRLAHRWTANASHMVLQVGSSLEWRRAECVERVERLGFEISVQFRDYLRTPACFVHARNS